LIFNYFILLFSVLGLELRAFNLEPLHQAYFCEGFFEIGSNELFGGAGFELQSS
jgi:hypothetical protein